MDDAPPVVAPEAVTFTLASTLDELIGASFWRAAELGTPIVEAIDAHRLNVVYPTDGSLVTVRIEARPGAFGGIQQGPLTAEEIAAADQKFSDMLAASIPIPPVLTARDEAREASFAAENPVYEVQRQ